jgi:hypothetical protein
MRGTDHQQADIYSYLSPEVRVRTDQLLVPLRMDVLLPPCQHVFSE